MQRCIRESDQELVPHLVDLGNGLVREPVQQHQGVPDLLVGNIGAGCNGGFSAHAEFSILLNGALEGVIQSPKCHGFSQTDRHGGKQIVCQTGSPVCLRRLGRGRPRCR